MDRKFQINLFHPACQVAIPGAKTPEQVEENCLASDLGPIPQDIISQIPK